MLTSALAVLTWLVAAQDLVAVRSSTPCPSADEVAVALRRVFPSGSLDPTGDVATVAESRVENVPWLDVRLRRADGSPKGEKSFRAEGSCSDRAELVATVIAIWEPDLQQPTLAPPRQRPIVMAIGSGAGFTAYKGVTGTGMVEGVVDWHLRPWGLRLAVGSELERRRGLDRGEVTTARRNPVKWVALTGAVGRLLLGRRAGGVVEEQGRRGRGRLLRRGREASMSMGRRTPEI